MYLVWSTVVTPRSISHFTRIPQICLLAVLFRNVDRLCTNHCRSVPTDIWLVHASVDHVWYGGIRDMFQTCLSCSQHHRHDCNMWLIFDTYLTCSTHGKRWPKHDKHVCNMFTMHDSYQTCHSTEHDVCYKTKIFATCETVITTYETCLIYALYVQNMFAC
jgi:hypothetical protein